MGEDALLPSNATPDTAPASIGARFAAFFAFLGREWRWLILGLIYLLGWYTPFTDHGTAGDGPLRWCWSECYSPAFTLGFELWMPVLAGIVIWFRRAQLRELWKQIVTNYPPGHRKREGNLIPLVVGCFLLFVSHLIEVKGIGVSALVLIVWGVVYRVYGPLMTRALIAPLGLLILMIPPPDHLTQELLSYKVAKVCVTLAAGLLSAIGSHATSLPNASTIMLNLHGYGAEISPRTCAGTNVAIAVTLILLTYHLCRRTDPTLVILSFVVGVVLSFTLQILRIVAIGLLTGPEPGIAHWLMEGWLISVLQIAVTAWVTVQIMKISFLDRLRTPKAVRHAARATNRGTNALADAFDRPASIFTSLGNLWIRSERATERMLKKLTPKSKKKRGRW